MAFREDFVWGAASSAYQTEGFPSADGGGESVWDVFCRRSGTVANGDDGSIACDGYHRFAEDIGLLASLGLRAYRFSTSWARIDPNGDGRWNEAGLQYYDRVVDCCLANGVTPWMTLYHWELPQALEVIRRHSLQLVGIHMHIGSGVDYGHLEQVCGAMVRQVVEFGQDLQAISAGGGLSIPYHEGEEAIDTDHYFGLWNAAREQIAKHLGHPVKLEIEPGRFLVAESGVLVSQVRSVKEMGSRHFVLIDAGFNDLMRPAMYGSYHHITALAADGRDLSGEPLLETVVAGPLCESGDVFTQQEGGKVETRLLPAVAPGDYLVLHDTGAYGASMSSNYNSRPLLPEVLFDNGSARLIRRRQTIEELLALELI